GNMTKSRASSVLAGPTEGSADSMSKTKTSKSKSKSRTMRVRAADLPRRTAADAARLRRNTQGAADTSDIKPVTQADVHSGRVKIRRRPREPKVSLTIRLDKDLVERFKAGGEGYQTRINDALR